jgi:cytoskeletal protein CcmA (bactofilin family)
MTINGFRMGAPKIAYIGAGVTVKGAIFVPDAIIVDGVVEGDVTAQSIRIGPSGAIKRHVVSMDVDVSGTLAEKTEFKEFLLVRSSGRVEGHVNCGDMQVQRGAVLAGGIFSVYSSAGVRPVNDNVPVEPRDGCSRPNPSAHEAGCRRIELSAGALGLAADP